MINLHFSFFLHNFARTSNNLWPKSLTTINDMKRVFTIFLFALIGSLVLLAEPYTPKTVPNPKTADAGAYVCNPDSILTVEEVMKLNSICAKIDSLSEVELAVVALKDIGDMQVYDFTLQLFNTWGVGRKEQNSGIMMLVATEARRVQIITGEGIEGIMTDAECSATIDEMLSSFKDGKYGAGLIIGAKSIGTKVTTIEAREELLLPSKMKDPNEEPWTPIAGGGLLGLGIFAIFARRQPKCPKCKCRDLEVIAVKINKKPSRISNGQGTRTYKCKACGHAFKKTYSISSFWNSGSGGYTINRDDNNTRSWGGGSGFSGGGSWGGGFSSGGGAGRGF